MGKAISFTVPGEPVGKGRPRFVRATGRTYTPEKTANFETLVKWEYHQQVGGRAFEDGATLGMRVYAYFSIPRSKPKWQQRDMAAGVIKHTHKPDADNLLKSVADALNRIAFDDDSSIAYVEVKKLYSEEPRTEITIWEMNSQ